MTGVRPAARPAAILDPTGGADVVRPRAARGLAPRAPDLAGATVGLLENTKHNAAYLLDQLGAALIREHGVASVVRGTKAAFGQPVPEDMLNDFAQRCDVMVVGVGDCGACSASAVADGISFEEAGLPSAVICSDAYVATATAMAGVQGVPDYPYLTTRHPVAILDHDEVDERAGQLLPQVLTLLTGKQGVR
ncbi:hypothetical protein A7K94_0200575 [Modestobacter sp. VKM Ac-2676]|nr:hypothetical protein A7K94_0200575 [Modestobacter sp. VKM Ac-2676]